MVILDQTALDLCLWIAMWPWKLGQGHLYARNIQVASDIWFTLTLFCTIFSICFVKNWEASFPAKLKQIIYCIFFTFKCEKWNHIIFKYNRFCGWIYMVKKKGATWITSQWKSIYMVRVSILLYECIIQINFLIWYTIFAMISTQGAYKII